MTLVTEMLIGTCVYWPPGSANSGGTDYDDYGQPSFGTAVEVNCRWDAMSEQYIAADNTKRVSRAIVWTDTDLSVGGVLWEGELANVSDLNTPKNNDGAWEIRRFDKVPDFQGIEYTRKAYL